jgi:hypothetical protein
MKKFLSVVLLMVSFNLISSPKELSSVTFNGVANLENQSFDKLTVHGAANFENIDAQVLHVAGALFAKNSEFVQVSISGGVKLQNCSVSQSLEVAGGLSAENSEFVKASISGGGNLKDSSVSQKLDVSGGFSAKNSDFCEVTVHGAGWMQDSTVNGTLKVGSGAKLIRCKIHDFVSSGSENELKNCDVAGTMTLEKPEVGKFLSFFVSRKHQEIRLIDTVVHGDIIFEQEGGKVVMKGNSRVDGKIINGIGS